MKKPELLAPAGSLTKLKFAFLYGADAVYIGGESFSLRVAAENFSNDEIREGIEYAHNLGKKVYITANILPHNEDLKDFEKYVKEVEQMGADAIIISDLGLFSIAKSVAPDLPIHISTQANNVNFASANMWHSLGAERVILARELSLNEIKEIKENISSSLELECFVHGAMCISYSGRCLLSNYMTSRDSNLGACSHPCRWKYNLVEEQRPGEYLPVFENDRGTFIFNSKDLCMLKHIPALIQSGVSSFKIEGRVKSEYYVAVITKAYRDAIDAYFDNNPVSEETLEEIYKVSHREYTTGFFFGKPDSNQQIYGSSSYVRNYDLVGLVTGYNDELKCVEVSQRNKFFVNDELEVLTPTGPFKVFKPEKMYNDKFEEIDSCPHATMTIYLPSEEKFPIGSFIRKNRI